MKFGRRRVDDASATSGAGEPGTAREAGETGSVFPLEPRTMIPSTIHLDDTGEGISRPDLDDLTLVEAPPSFVGRAPEVGGDAAATSSAGGRPRLEATLLALAALVVYLLPWHGPGIVPTSYTSRDTLGNRLVAASLASRRSLDITPWFDAPPDAQLLAHIVDARSEVGAAGARTTYVPKYPVGTGLLAAPFFHGAPATALEHRLAGNPWRSLVVREHLAAATMTALAVGLFHLLLRGVAFGGLGVGASFLLSLALAFGSPLWSANAQGLWSHTGSTLLLVLLLHAFARTGVGAVVDPSRRLFFVGLLVAAAIACRPSHVVWCAAIPVAIVVVARRFGNFSPAEVLNRLAAFALGVAAGLAALAFLHVALYGEPLGPYVRGLVGLGRGTIAVEARAPISEAIAGQLFSPGVGLFVFCPLVLLGVFGVRAAWREGVDEIAVLIAAVGLVAMNALNPFWWGGWSWGPRLFADAMPLLLLLAAPAVRALVRHRAAAVLLALALAWSVALHALGVVRFDYGWFFERPELAADRTPLWRLSDGLVADALRAGHPAGDPSAAPAALFRRARLQPPEWLAAALGAPARVTLVAFDESAATTQLVEPPFSGLAPGGALPYRLLGAVRLGGAYAYRDRMTLRLPSLDLPPGARAYLVTLLPAIVGHDDADGARGAVRVSVATSPDAPLSEPMPAITHLVESAGGGIWRCTLWPLPRQLDAASGLGVGVTIHRARTPVWGDPLATIPPVELIAFPFVLVVE